MMRATTTATAALCAAMLLAGCDPVVPLGPLPTLYGLVVYTFDSSTGEFTSNPGRVVAVSTETTWELDALQYGNPYFGVEAPGLYTVYVDVEGYVPQVIENVEIRSHVVDAVEGFHLVTVEVYLEPAQ